MNKKNFRVHHALCQFGLLQQTTINWVAKTTLFTVLEAGKFKIKVPADSVSGEGCLLNLQTATFSLYHHTLEKESDQACTSEQASSLVSSHKGANPIMRTPNHLNLITSQWPYLQLPSHWGLGFQPKNFGGTQTCSP